MTIKTVAFAMGWLAFSIHIANAQGERLDMQPVPMLQATDGNRSCETPPQAQLSLEELRAQAHYRIERGNSCYQAGRCRLPNSYLYDAEIVPRAKKALQVAGNFDNTSIWVEGQRRWVWLKGCVRNRDQLDAAERLVRSLDDVESVVNELVIKD